MTSPIDELLALCKAKEIKADRQFLSYALAKGVVTPAYLEEAVGARAMELAEEIRDDTRRTWEEQRKRMDEMMGKRPRTEK